MPHEQQNNLLNAVNPLHSAVVEACAGSGKTWLLTARMLRYLLEGGASYQMVAITFTRKAAAEMLSRLTSLAQQLQHASDDELGAMLAERGLNITDLPHDQALLYCQRARGLYQQLQQQSPAITTFHSWFFNVLKQAPLEFGSFEGINLLEADEALLYDVWQQWLVAISADSHSEDLKHWQALIEVIDIDALRELMFTLARHPSEWHAFDHTTQIAAWQQKISDQQAELVSLIDQRGLEPWARRWSGCWASGTDKEQIFANELLDCLTAPRWFESFKNQALTKQTLRKPRSKNALNAVIDGVSEADIRQMIQHAVDQQLDTFALQQSYTLNQHINALAKLWFSLIDQEKKRQHVLTFADLEYQLFQLVRSPYLAILLAQQAPLQHLLIDEFQDTNPVQWTIVKTLLQEYRDANLSVSVFLVGDPKQSIYRFRRANPEIFAAARDWLVEHQHAQTFFANSTRRLSQNMVQRVNTLFQDQADWNLFKPHQSLSLLETGAGVCTAFFTTSKTDQAADEIASNTDEIEQDESPELALQEANYIATSLKKMMSQPIDGELIRSSDILVLTKDRKNWNVIESALKQSGLSVQRQQKTSLWHTLEGLDFLSWLRVIYQGSWHAQYDIALLTLLKSPYLRAFDTYDRERELLALLACAAELREKNASDLSLVQAAWQELAQQPTDNPWASSWRTIEQWQALAKKIGLHELFNAVVCESNLYQSYAQSLYQNQQQSHQLSEGLQPLLDQQIANLSRLIELTLSSMDAAGHSAEAWLAELDQRFLQAAHTGSDNALLQAQWTQASVDKPLAPLLDQTADRDLDQTNNAITLLTIHEAKGLEAKVIWLADCARRKANDSYLRLLIDWRASDIAPQQFCVLAGKQTQHRLIKQSLERDQEQADQESWNLLYVAVTRAKQVFMVSGHAGKASKNSLYKRVAERWSTPDPSNHFEHILLQQTLNTPTTKTIINAEKHHNNAPQNDLKLYQQSVVSPAARQLLNRLSQVESTAPIVHINQRYGKIWHALLESALRYLKTLDKLPSVLADILDWQGHWQNACTLNPDAYALNQDVRNDLISAAARVLQMPIWKSLWHEGLGEAGRRVEQTIVDTNGKQHRLDVLVIQSDLASTTITVIDFKWQIDNQNLAGYREQLQRYAVLLRAMFAQAHIDTILIDANANFFV